MQHKNNFDESKLFEYSEEEEEFLCCNEASLGCPSLHLSYEQAKQNLLNRGMSQEDFDGFVGFLKGFAKRLINEEIKTITHFRDYNGYE